MLIRHSTCFILYIITVTLFYCAFGYYTFKPTTQNYKYAAAIGIFFNVGSCISQLLLVNIFWGLGTNLKKNQGDQSRDSETTGRRQSILSAIVDIHEEAFDEDAELQANIWNSLVRKMEEVSPEDNFIVTA